MTTVETMITLSISPKGMSLEELESKIGRALQEAGIQLLVQACRAMEAKKLEQEQKPVSARQAQTVAPADTLGLHPSLQLAISQKSRADPVRISEMLDGKMVAISWSE